MLPAPVSRRFNKPGLVNEEKYDGFRALSSPMGHKVRVWWRNPNDLSAGFAGIAQLLAGLIGGDLVLDGDPLFESGPVVLWAYNCTNISPGKAEDGSIRICSQGSLDGRSVCVSSH